MTEQSRYFAFGAETLPQTARQIEDAIFSVAEHEQDDEVAVRNIVDLLNRLRRHGTPAQLQAVYDQCDDKNYDDDVRVHRFGAVVKSRLNQALDAFTAAQFEAALQESGSES